MGVSIHSILESYWSRRLSYDFTGRGRLSVPESARYGVQRYKWATDSSMKQISEREQINPEVGSKTLQKYTTTRKFASGTTYKVGQ